jgi:methylated-DNA-[protein]-cysteine S-methyltransferase
MDTYRQSVYALLTKIPKGKVTTYGIIAKKLKMPTPRLVGRILHQNTNPKKYPCHRVVFSNGSLA